MASSSPKGEERGDGGVGGRAGGTVFRLPIFDPLAMNPQAFVVAYGMRGSGKSRLFAHWMWVRRRVIRYMLVFSCTDSATGFWRRRVPPIFCANDLYPELVSRAIQRNEALLKSRPPGLENLTNDDLTVTLMFDDVMNNGKALRSEALTYLAVNGRHAKTQPYFCVQNPVHMPYALRSQCQIVVVFAEKDEKILKRLYDENFRPVVPSFQDFYELVQQVTKEKGRVLVLDLIANQLYIYRANLEDLETREWNPYLGRMDDWHVSADIQWPYYYRYYQENQSNKFDWTSGAMLMPMSSYTGEAGTGRGRGGHSASTSAAGRRKVSTADDGAAGKPKKKRGAAASTGRTRAIVLVREDGTQERL